MNRATTQAVGGRTTMPPAGVQGTAAGSLAVFWIKRRVATDDRYFGDVVGGYGEVCGRQHDADVDSIRYSDCATASSSLFLSFLYAIVSSPRDSCQFSID